MEIRDLRALLAVVRTGSFTIAAEELGYTQSAVSQQIAALERELGHVLLQRRPVRATAAGERLAEHALRITTRIDVARSELSYLDPEVAEIRIAASPLAAVGILAEALRELRATTPTLVVNLATLDRRAASAEVAAGRVDLAIVDGIAGPDNPLAVVEPGLLSVTAVIEAPLAVVLPAGHPLGRRASIALDALYDAPWIAAPSLAGDAVDQVLRLAPDASFRVTYHGDDLLTLFELVAAGHGIALLPSASCAGVEGVVGVAIDWPALVHRIEALTLRTTTSRQRRLVEAIRARAS